MKKPIMTGDIWADIHDFQKYFEIDKRPMTKRRLQGQLEFLTEELNETKQAFVDGNAEEVLDGLIDLLVVATGTIAMVNAYGAEAWREVMRANINKVVGFHEKRPNSEGVDLIKPEGWRAPDLSFCVGNLRNILEEK